MSNNQLVRYKKGKFSFEVVTKPGTVRLFLLGKLGWEKVLSVDAIFTNFKKANLAKSSDLKAVFGTDDVNKCAEIMVREGDSQVSAKERREDIETHRKQVITYMHRSFIDQAGLPYPIARLEGVLEESKIQIDPSISIHKIVDEIVKRMLGKLVFKKNSLDYTLKVSKKYAKECGNIVYRFSPNMHKEIRTSDGITWKICLSPPDINDFTSEMNKLTEGDFQLSVGHALNTPQA